MNDTLDQKTAYATDIVSGFPLYQFRPSMMGAEYTFRLAPDALEWDIGRRNGRIAYRNFVRVRLGFRPANLAGSRFTAEIWSREGLKLLISSVSARSIFDFENRGPAYRAFVMELCQRIAAAGAGCRFDAGFPHWRWWPAMVVSLAVLAALLYLWAKMLLAGELAIGAALIAFALFFLWQIGSMIVRNRPHIYSPTAIPNHVLPSA